MAEKSLTKKMQNLVEETSHTVAGAPRRLVLASRGAIDMTREEADHLLERGENLFEQLVKRGEKIEEQQAHRLESWVKAVQQRRRKQMHVAEEQIEQQVQAVLRTLHIPSMEDVQRLDQELDRISQKLDAHLGMMAEQIVLPIEGYDDLTAKEVVDQLADLDHEQLLAVKQYELANKDRKTVLRAVDARLEDQES